MESIRLDIIIGEMREDAAGAVGNGHDNVDGPEKQSGNNNGTYSLRQ